MPMYVLRTGTARVQETTVFIEADSLYDAKLAWIDQEYDVDHEVDDKPYTQRLVVHGEECDHDALCCCPYCVPKEGLRDDRDG